MTDILREFRGDNKRLVAYLCRPNIVRELVTYCVRSGPVDEENTKEKENSSTATAPANGVSNPDSKKEDKDPKLGTAADKPELEEKEEDPPADVPDELDCDDDDEATKTEANSIKYTYVASELLSADIHQLCDVVVGDPEVMDIIFSCLETSPPGELNPVIATHFSKVIVSLLKTRNTETIAQMKRLGRGVTDGLIKHICLGPIADLLVRLLDAPENEPSYSQTILPPSESALNLLAQADVLNGLANCFVESSTPATNCPGATESAVARRQREESMSNVTATIIGLTERILQLPNLGVTIPNELSPYHTPKAISRLLDSGLYAAGVLKEPVIEPADQPGTANAIAVLTSDVIVSGNNSALLHSLSLVATLMTTKSNLWESDRMDYMESDRTASLNSNEEPASDDPVMVDMQPTDDNLMDFSQALSPGSLLRPKSPGEIIISTSILESELVVRFERLSQMFGTDEEDESSKLPLGSLRLSLAEFFTACMKNTSRSTVDHIVELQIPQKLLDLFLRYEWSSMLHSVVSTSIVSALEGGASSSPARFAWFNTDLVQWLLMAWSRNEKKETDDKSVRAGYMGHLIRIGARLRNFLDDTPNEQVSELVSNDSIDKFDKFVNERLGPAHCIEITPLCDDDSEPSEPEVIDDPRDLLDMGVGEVIEGLTQGDSAIAIERFSKFLLNRSSMEEYEEEEIVPVDVGDLSHFGGDDENIEDGTDTRNAVDVDHDIPPEMQEQLYKDSSKTKRPKAESETVISNGVVELRDEEDDDGTFESFSAKKSADVDKLADGLRNVEIVEEVPAVEPLAVDEEVITPVPTPTPPPTLEVDAAAAVTEIEEPRPVTPGIGLLKNDAVADDSSDDEVGDWVAFDAEAISGDAKSSPGKKKSPAKSSPAKGAAVNVAMGVEPDAGAKSGAADVAAAMAEAAPATPADVVPTATDTAAVTESVAADVADATKSAATDVAASTKTTVADLASATKNTTADAASSAGKAADAKAVSQ